MPKAKEPSAAALSYAAKVLKYDPITGEFSRTGGKRAVGWVHSSGHRRIYCNGQQFYLHRLAWFFATGVYPDASVQIDHINHNPQDNRLANLRLVDQSENSRNMRLRRSNTSGHVGVRQPAERKGLWEARIMVDYKPVVLGVFKTFDEAVAARKSAEANYGFHPNHGSSK